MGAENRLRERLAAVDARSERLLVLYLTLGDPLLRDPCELARVAADAGADLLELGIPTRGTRPRGDELASSFDRARDVRLPYVWGTLRAIRDAVPGTPLLPLVYPQTVGDIGADRLLASAAGYGADGLVLTAPDHALPVHEVVSAGLAAIPLVRPENTLAEQVRLERAADLLTYRDLGHRSGVRLVPSLARDLTARYARNATRPFLVGFGIRDERDIRAVAPYASGVVIGSQLLRELRRSAPGDQLERLDAAVRRWKAATRLATDQPPADSQLVSAAVGEGCG
ncbi:MAG: tryptophan synthase subunit alpha [Micromonosporaceae bacterium]